MKSSTAAESRLSISQVLSEAHRRSLPAPRVEGPAHRSAVVAGSLWAREVQTGLIVNAHDVTYLSNCAFDADKERSLSCGLVLTGDVVPIALEGYLPARQALNRPFVMGFGQSTPCGRTWRAGAKSRGAGFTLTPRFLERFGDLAEEDGLAVLHDYLRPGFHSTALPASHRLTQIAHRLLDNPYGGRLADLFAETHALQFVLETAILLRDEDRAVRRIGRLNYRRASEAREILDASLAHPPSSLELARSVGINLTTLQASFKAAFGTTLFGYVRDQRLEMGRELILEHGLGVAEAGYRVGFTSPAAFTAAYRRHFGRPPSAEDRPGR
ncbi:AraC family transcriptional regulator [Caulobacter sp. CCNWLY153]|uniref:helix-turn-helix transcriptional regulator n=1 Tax=unclassified Caulobacter TaxID=2648921 RepID=UPI002FEF904F